MANYFTDRVVEYPGRVTLTPTGDANTYDMARAEGSVTEAGTPFNAATFNGIAQDIIDKINSLAARVADIESHAIVEIGDSDGWTYKKYADGTFEAYINTSLSVAINTASGGVYFGNTSCPMPNIGVTSIIYAGGTYSGGEGVWLKVNNVTNAAFGVGFVSSISRQATAREVRLYVTGTYS